MEKSSLLRLNAGLGDLEKIRQFVEDKAKALRIDSSATYDILLAVTEMVTNIIEHGYRGKSGLIEIEVERQRDSLVVYVRDQAPPFDPTQVPSPDLSLPWEQRPLGKMGIHLTREFMDRMSYRNGPEGGNEIILVKEGIIPN